MRRDLHAKQQSAAACHLIGSRYHTAEMVSQLTGDGVVSVGIPFTQTALIVLQRRLSLCESQRQRHGKANAKHFLFLVCVGLYDYVDVHLPVLYRERTLKQEDC